jgi:hypothetical protein
MKYLELICVGILLADGFFTSIKMHFKDFGSWCSLLIYVWAMAWYCFQPPTALTTLLLIVLAACAVEHRRRGVNGVLS